MTRLCCAWVDCDNRAAIGSLYCGMHTAELLVMSACQMPADKSASAPMEDALSRVPVTIRRYSAAPPPFAPDEICEHCVVYRDRMQCEDADPIARCLCEIARKHVQEDGWTEALQGVVIGAAFILLAVVVLVQIAMRMGWTP